MIVVALFFCLLYQNPAERQKVWAISEDSADNLAQSLMLPPLTSPVYTLRMRMTGSISWANFCNFKLNTLCFQNVLTALIMAHAQPCVSSSSAELSAAPKVGSEQWRIVKESLSCGSHCPRLFQLGSLKDDHTPASCTPPHPSNHDPDPPLPAPYRLPLYTLSIWMQALSFVCLSCDFTRITNSVPTSMHWACLNTVAGRHSHDRWGSGGTRRKEGRIKRKRFKEKGDGHGGADAILDFGFIPVNMRKSRFVWDCSAPLRPWLIWI